MTVFSRFARYFDQVARQSSVRKAAEGLNIAASAVDRQILLVEKELGTPLFERLPHGLRLTSAGELLVAGIRRWRADFDRVMSQIEDLRGLKRGHVTVLSTQGAATEFLPAVIAAFSREYPRITYEVTATETRFVTERILSGDAEIGVTFNPPQLPTLSVKRSAQISVGALAPHDHPLAKKRNLRLSDCAGYPVIVPHETFGFARGARCSPCTNGGYAAPDRHQQ
jgi:DNA-binding transcriptional LysR family regulator